ncbi:MAG: holin, BlyA family protein [Oscillospiraceae bacterium]|nr:holin, BlyA family protein [Oscillospiraceae bacterium]
MKNYIEKTTDKAAYFAARALYAVRKQTNEFIRNEDGETNLVAILLIIVVTVGLVAIFKDKLTDVIETIFKRIQSSVKSI